MEDAGFFESIWLYFRDQDHLVNFFIKDIMLVQEDNLAWTYALIICLSLDENGITWDFIQGILIGLYNYMAYEAYFVLVLKRPRVYQDYLKEKNTM